MTTKGFGKKWKLLSQTKSYRLITSYLKTKNRLVTDSSIIANTFINYFINITNTLNLKPMPKSTSLIY